MREDDANGYKNRYQELVLAIGDLLESAAAAEALVRHEAVFRDLYLRRALETAVVVCYARPFKSSERGLRVTTCPGLLPPVGPMLDLHNRHLSRRDQAFAHTDKYDASGRQALHIDGSFGEEWLPALAPGEHDLHVRLCRHLALDYAKRAQAIRDRLVREGIAPGPPPPTVPPTMS